MTLDERYEAAVSTPSDICEHLPLLRSLAADCEHVTEFGLRDASGSTVAFLAARPKTLVSWDINPHAVVSMNVQDLLLAVAADSPRTDGLHTFFQPRVGDTLKIAPIEPTDMLFIDSLHTARQLKAELERHVDPMARPEQVRKYLVFHDTATFGMKGEDGSEPGLRAAIRYFQRSHAFPLWRLLHDLSNCNGLVVLERVRP